MAEIDVVMSVFNTAKYLSDTLKSIQSQTIADIRIIIIDDGSTDDTREIVTRAQESDPRIVYRYQENAGIVAAVNAGMQLCTAPFIARHDGDDISYPHRFAEEQAYLLANENCVAVSALARHIDENGKPIGTTTRAKDMSLVDDSALPANEPYILQPLLMMRRDAFMKTGGYRLLTIGEDTDLYWRMMKIGNLHILPEVLGDYRIHANSISSQSVVSGRRMSAWAQVSALSAQRMRKNLPDIQFTRELQEKIDSQLEMIDLFRVIEPVMKEDEKPWFFSAMAAKLIEACYYRPFEPSRSDIDYIVSVPGVDGKVSSRRFYDSYEKGILSAGIRIAIDGRISDALRLVPRRQWPKLIGRIIFRVLGSKKLKNGMKAILRK
ncbi:MAG: glycosyltransferase [Janthinobacterium lividum]